MSAAPQNRFTKTFGADGRHETTIDARTGLEWQAIPFPDAMNQADAEKACAALDLAGHSDWRLPELGELESIRDLTRYSPAIDPEFFPDTECDWYWTATPAAWASSCAWFVGFDYGYSDDSHRDDDGFVRAVRSLPAGQ